MNTHTYYNTLATSSFLRTASVEQCDALLDSGRCSFDELGNVIAIDGRNIVERDGATFKFAEIESEHEASRIRITERAKQMSVDYAPRPVFVYQTGNEFNFRFDEPGPFAHMVHAIYKNGKSVNWNEA